MAIDSGRANFAAWNFAAIGRRQVSRLLTRVNDRVECHPLTQAVLTLLEPHNFPRVIGVLLFELPEGFFCFLGYYFRQRNFHFYKLVAAEFRISQAGKSAFAEAKFLARFRSGRNF